ncbi:electron transport complex subunit RsxG [Porticoccus sp. W117]|uniref:electron transport complex subunit RsxG n=1 Tax=Porticoccus sp. W117 TaxID=3054777 RepID=UPI0025927FF8|nr:electron transport complex subunit RsxG [Porticoccus sp. W117]MDM3870957.1 electron transport complex subunit RsxG [Porticoccus sp. W117]
MSTERASIRKNSLILGAVALVTGTLLATTQVATKDKIALAQRQAEQKALLEILPIEQHSNDLLMDVVPVPEQHWELLGLDKGGQIHIGRDENGQVNALILPTVAKDGYSGDIHMIIGIRVDGTVAGVRITDHRETPGLGDKVELKKSNWVLSFNGKSLSQTGVGAWAVKKDGGEFDQFTGATITPRAVVNQIRQVLYYFEQDKERLLKQAQKPAGSDK